MDALWRQRGRCACEGRRAGGGAEECFGCGAEETGTQKEKKTGCVIGRYGFERRKNRRSGRSKE